VFCLHIVMLFCKESSSQWTVCDIVYNSGKQPIYKANKVSK